VGEAGAMTMGTISQTKRAKPEFQMRSWRIETSAGKLDHSSQVLQVSTTISILAHTVKETFIQKVKDQSGLGFAKEDKEALC